MDEAQFYLIVDAIRVPDAALLCAKNGIEYGQLYTGTPWKAQMENSPLWINTREADAVWQQWLTNEHWASSSLLFQFDHALSQADIMASLQQHITITSEDGRLLFFRFYSPKTLIRILPHIEATQISALCGLACELRFSPLVPGAEDFSPLINPSASPTLDSLMISQTLAEDLLS